MNMTSKWILVSAVVSLAAFLCMTVGLPVVQGSADHVRWDIINFNAATTPPTVSAGGFAIAAARNPSTLTIKLTGSGTFIGPVSGGTSSGATGGGTWQTFSGTTSTGSGTYEVRELISWQFANFQTPSIIDLIDDGAGANGNALLRIEYSDGSNGVLGVGDGALGVEASVCVSARIVVLCCGPGAGWRLGFRGLLSLSPRIATLLPASSVPSHWSV